MRPEFFDVFGLFTFLFIGGVGTWSLVKKMPLPRWIAVLLVLIGIAGLAIDGTMVVLFVLA